jgi:hypothetical protein
MIFTSRPFSPGKESHVPTGWIQGLSGHWSKEGSLTPTAVHTLVTLRGCAIAQAVSLWVPTTVARVQNRILSCGICSGQSGAGTGFLRVIRFPLPIFIPPISSQSPSPIIWGWYNRPVVAKKWVISVIMRTAYINCTYNSTITDWLPTTVQIIGGLNREAYRWKFRVAAEDHFWFGVVYISVWERMAVAQSIDIALTSGGLADNNGCAV